MLRVENLRYRYEDRLFEFNLEAKKGEITAILGKSGAGKSTLLSLIAGFLEPISGDIFIDEKSIVNLPPYKRPLSILFQENNLFSHLRLYENIALGINPKLKLSPKEKEFVSKMATSLGIGDLLHRLPSEISGGQKQRAALCRAMVRKRDVLLLDEPFSALDYELKDEMLELVLDLSKKENMAILMVTHFEEDVKKVASKSIKI